MLIGVGFVWSINTLAHSSSEGREGEMGRSPCCSKEGLNRGAWTALEDNILTAYIKVHGEGKWRHLPMRAGLKRCGKSCRLRWVNYLRPDIKRGNISHDEEELIIRLHKLLGNRWSLIAGRLPGRTDNEIKNYWNTTLGKKANAQSTSGQSNKTPPIKCTPKWLASGLTATRRSNSSSQAAQVNHPKATRCTKVVVSPESTSPTALPANPATFTDAYMNEPRDSILSETDFHTDPHGPQFQNFDRNEFQASDGDDAVDYNQNLYIPQQSSTLDGPILKESVTDTSLLDEDYASLDFDCLAYFLDNAAEWA